MDPKYADAYFFRAVLYYAALQDFARAQIDLQNYLLLDPAGKWQDKAHSLLGRRHEAVGIALHDYRSSDEHDVDQEVAGREEPGRTEQETPMAQPPTFEIGNDKVYRATITTSRGTIVLDLDPKLAPNTVNNFVALSRQGYYDGLTFHRVVPEFVIQGGCPEGSGRGGPGYRFADEPVQAEYTLGAVAMANAGPEHERLAVLHLHRRLHAQAHQGLQPLRVRGRGRRRRGRHPGRRRDADRGDRGARGLRPT